MSIINFKQPLLGLDLINTTPDPFNRLALLLDGEGNYYKVLKHHDIVRDYLITAAINNVNSYNIYNIEFIPDFIPFGLKDGSENWENINIAPLTQFSFILLIANNTEESFNNMVMIERELMKMNPREIYVKNKKTNLYEKRCMQYNGLLNVCAWEGRPKGYNISSEIEKYIKLLEEK